jgi:uncharacterized protein
MKMTLTTIFILILIGLGAGLLSGFVGVGGGLIIVPALVYLLGFSQLAAQGTSLAVLLLPVGFLAVWHYHKQGNVDISASLIIGAAFILGALGGSHYAHKLDINKIKFAFALLMLIASFKLLWASSKDLFFN